MKYADDVTSPSVTSLDGNYRDRDSRKGDARVFLRAGKTEMDENERWYGNLFKISEATDENDFDFDIAVFFCVETHIDKEEKCSVLN